MRERHVSTNNKDLSASDKNRMKNNETLKIITKVTVHLSALITGLMSTMTITQACTCDNESNQSTIALALALYQRAQ